MMIEMGIFQVPPERKAAIEAVLDDILINHIDQWGESDAGALMAGIMLGARLHETDPETCSVVVSELERSSGGSVNLAAESIEIRLRQVVDSLVAA